MTDDQTPETTGSTYTMGYSEEFQELLARRSAATNAAHLLPHLEPGFSDIQAGASFESFDTAEDTQFFHGFASGWFFSPNVVEVVTKHGLASRDQIDVWRRNLDQWRDVAGAFSAIAWGEATGRKP